MSRRPIADDLAPYCQPVDGGGGVGGGNVAPPRTPSDNRKRVAFERGGGGGGRVVAGDDDDDENDDENDDDDGRGGGIGIGGGNGRTELKRRCIDYHTPAVLDVSCRLYRKANRRSHAMPGGSGLAGYPHLQCHANYLRWMGLPGGEGMGCGGAVPSVAFLTHCAHVTRAKNSNPVM
jgi:hypothetical protein